MKSTRNHHRCPLWFLGRRRWIPTVWCVALLLCALPTARAADSPGAGRLPFPLTQMVSRVVFTAFDTETTGFSPGSDRIVELSAVCFTVKEVLWETNWLINPQRRIPPYARAVHGITDKMVAGRPTFRRVWPHFRKAASGTILLAHNAAFDVGFINAELKRAGMDSVPLPVLDSLHIFRRWYPRSPSHSLAVLVEYLKLPATRFHRALDDAAYLAAIFQLHYRGGRDETLQSLLQAAGGRILWIGPQSQ